MRIERLARSRKAMVFGFMLALVTAGLLLTTKPAHAKTFTVNSTGDAGDIDPGDGVCDVNNIPVFEACTLRGAIQEANATRGKDTISFDIGGGSGVKTISPNPELPTITEPLTIDGYTQGDSTADTADDAVPNTEAVGTNAVLKIVVNGPAPPRTLSVSGSLAARLPSAGWRSTASEKAREVATASSFPAFLTTPTT